LTVWQMGSVRRIYWILNDLLHRSTEIILISVQVWLLFCEMCLAALWDERKLIQVEFAIFRIATFLPISINLWQQKYKDLNCGMCGGIAKSCDPLWSTSLTEKYKSLQNPMFCCYPQRWILWVSSLLIVTLLLLVGPAGTPVLVDQNCSQWPMVWSG